MKSPCTEDCRIDRISGWCQGCGRTKAEIKAWKSMTPFHRQAALRDLGRRLDRLKQRLAAEP